MNNTPKADAAASHYKLCTWQVSYEGMEALARELERENARLRASLGAIHWNASRADADQVVLASIKDECEHAIPELKTVLANNQGDTRSGQKTNTAPSVE